MTTLTRPGRPFKSNEISVSCDASTHWLAVVEHGGYLGSPSLNVYNSSYEHITHVHLSYTPRSVTAVAAVKDWIFIVEWYDDSLRVYNWGGEEVGRLSNQQLGLGGEYIYGIGQAGDSGLESLHLYHIQ